jgi:hypothetical protein
MNTKVLHIATLNFVETTFRDRFVHEASKKPSKLRARVCHEINRVFQARYKAGLVRGLAGESWYLLDNNTAFRQCSWGEVSSLMRLGIGILAISENGDKFYAESEDSSGMEVWAGEVEQIT